MKTFLLIFFCALSLQGASIKYQATVTNVHDGDTLTVDIPLGFDVVMKNQKVRFLGLDAPELSTPAGKEVAAYVQALLNHKEITLLIEVDAQGNPNREKYGRLLVTVFLGDENINLRLLKEGKAKAYDGGKRIP